MDFKYETGVFSKNRNNLRRKEGLHIKSINVQTLKQQINGILKKNFNPNSKLSFKTLDPHQSSQSNLKNSEHFPKETIQKLGSRRRLIESPNTKQKSEFVKGKANEAQNYRGLSYERSSESLLHKEQSSSEKKYQNYQSYLLQTQFGKGLRCSKSNLMKEVKGRSSEFAEKRADPKSNMGLGLILFDKASTKKLNRKYLLETSKGSISFRDSVDNKYTKKSKLRNSSLFEKADKIIRTANSTTLDSYRESHTQREKVDELLQQIKSMQNRKSLEVFKKTIIPKDPTLSPINTNKKIPFSHEKPCGQHLKEAGFPGPTQNPEVFINQQGETHPPNQRQPYRRELQQLKLPDLELLTQYGQIKEKTVSHSLNRTNFENGKRVLLEGNATFSKYFNGGLSQSLSKTKAQKRQRTKELIEESFDPWEKRGNLQETYQWEEDQSFMSAKCH